MILWVTLTEFIPWRNGVYGMQINWVSKYSEHNSPLQISHQMPLSLMDHTRFIITFHVLQSQRLVLRGDR